MVLSSKNVTLPCEKVVCLHAFPKAHAVTIVVVMCMYLYEMSSILVVNDLGSVAVG